jgi:hypothetical protein
MLYTFNKLKSFIERDLRKLLTWTTIKKDSVKNEIVYIPTHRNRFTPILKEKFVMLKK